MGWFEFGVVRDKAKEFLAAQFRLGGVGISLCAANQREALVPKTVPAAVPEVCPKIGGHVLE